MADTASGKPTVGRTSLRLDVEVGADGESAALSVRGEIDVSTSPLLERIVAAVIDHGVAPLVIDAGGVGFIDCSGLRVVLAAADRLGRDGAELIIRSPSTPVVRLLEVTGVAALVRIEPGTSRGPDRHEDEALSQVAAIPAGSDAVDATLAAVVILAAATIATADGVSLTLLRHGQLVTAAATDDTMRKLDQHQYDSGQGPCVHAATKGQRFHFDLLEDEQRWSAFTPHVIEQGFQSILSTPVMTATGPVGALNVYSRSTNAFHIGEHDLATQFAAQAATIVSHASDDLTVEHNATRLQEALHTRDIIAQAQGGR